MKKLVVLTMAVVVGGAACSREPRAIECKIHADCNLSSGGSCDINPMTLNRWCSYPDDTCPSGRRWSDFDTGDGLSGVCQEDMTDAGMPDAGVDSAVPDAMTVADAMPMVDAAPPVDANSDATLETLVLSEGSLQPAFSPLVTSYVIELPLAVDAVTVTPTATLPTTTITVNGNTVGSGSTSPAISLSLGDNTITIVATAQNGSFTTYTVSARRGPGILQQAYAKASNTEAGDQFGYKVALSGDTLVVGATSEDSSSTGVGGAQLDNGADGSGAVYVFVRTAGVWAQQAYIKASNAEAGDGFGGSIALDGDTLVVGATGEDSNATGVNADESNNSAASAGAAYVFVRSGATWTQQAYLKASNTNGGDLFGITVDVSGNTVAVGAIGEASAATGINGNEADNSATYAGAVYVFARESGTWTQQAYIKASNTDASDLFGQDIALDAETLVVGAPKESSNAIGVNGNQSSNTAASSGAVYVFTRTGITWSQQAYLKASNTGSLDDFGSSVALSGDTLVVGAPGEDSSASGINGPQTNNDANASGAVYVFVRSGGAWTQQAYVKSSNSGNGDIFGSGVALDGDVLAVAASGESSSATGVNGNQSDNGAGASGAVYLFVRVGTNWSQQAYIKASNSETLDRLGGLIAGALAVSGDTIAVGAYLEDSSATGVNGDEANNGSDAAGAVYVFQ